MPSLGSAPPTSYMVDGKQYIIIPTFDKADTLDDGGDELFAFTIK